MLPTMWKVAKLLPNVSGNSTFPLIKSDRINTIKRQYDAFLEEDKKRKERNEYILEKLDKMRYCNAVVPVRQKPTVFAETQTATLHNNPKPSVATPTSLIYNDQRYLHMEMPRNHFNETVLQEISKKYILIPKLKPTYEDYITDSKQKLDDNTDWKSKYKILEQLKRDEKESNSPTHEEIYQATQDSSNMNYKEIPTKEDNQPLLKYKHEMPDNISHEYEIPDYLPPENKLSYNLQSYPHKVGVEQIHHNNINETSETTNNGLEKYEDNIENTNLALEGNVNVPYEHFESKSENYVYDQTKSNDNIEIIDENINKNEYVENLDESMKPELDTVIKSSEENSMNMVNIEAGAIQDNMENKYVPVPSETNDQEQPQETDISQQNTDQNTYLDREEVTLVQNMNTSDIVDVINSATDPDSGSKVVDNTEYPIETINVQDFTPHDVQLQDGVNNNPEPQVLVGQEDMTYHYDPVVEPTENASEPTNAFDTEPEFYNEQVEQSYDYTEEGVADNYNAEYPVPSENYEQTEYAYYEGAKTEQPYPEAVQNEETLQRYDQNYEQQYGVHYDQEAYPQQGYDQDYSQPEYAEQMQHYEAPDQTEQNETVAYENQDNLTPQYVEQQLDSEQGYAEKQDENTVISNNKKPEEKQQNLGVGDQQLKAQ